MVVPEDMGRDFLRESFCLGETSWIPAYSAKRSIVLSTVLVHRCSELRPGKSHFWPGWIYLRACKVPWPLKAANRGHTNIKLRERGTKKLHIFTGERVQVNKTKGAPAWMGDKIWKPMVKKVGTEKLE